MKLLCPKCMVRYGTEGSYLCSVCEDEQLMQTFKRVVDNHPQPDLCEECGLHPRRGALAVCNECCEKAWSKGQSNPQPTPAKPPFFLWDFRKRKVCDLSYLYGGMLGLAVGLTIGSMDSSGWFNVAAVFCLVISKYLHSKLPLSGKDDQ